MAVFQGTAITKGIGIGPAFLYQPVALNIAARKPAAAGVEVTRFEEALARVRQDVQSLRAALPALLRYEADRLLEFQELLLADPALVDRTRGAIFEGRPAETAWKEAVDAYLAIFAPIQDEDLRAHAVALSDVGRQVLAALLGVSRSSPFPPTREAVVLAHTLGPTEFLQLAAHPPQGLCLVAGTLLSPAVLMTRRLELPTVVGLDESLLQQVEPGSTVVVDGGIGLVEFGLDEEALSYYRHRQRLLKSAQPAFDVTAPAHTTDGWRIDVRADLERPDRLLLALSLGAEGVGLAYTDYLFVGKKTLPSEEEQVVAYREVLAQVPGDRVTFCTLSAGSEEVLPFPSELEESANPLLGLRAVRLSLAYLSAFREQLRAILRAGAGRSLGIVFPLAETMSELRAAQEWMRRAQQDLRNAGMPYCQDVSAGLLVQTPLALLNLDVLLSEADSCFLDLDRITEYLLVCERGNRRVAHLFRPLHPTVLRLVRDAVAVVHRQGKRLDLCGEYAGNRGAIALLLGLGADGFCLVAEKIPEAKALLRAISVPEAQELSERALALQSAAEVEALVEDYLEHKQTLRGP